MTLASKNPFEWKFLYKYEDLMKKYDPISLKQEKFKGLSPKNNKAPKQLELIEEEEVKEKKEKVFEKVNKLNQGSFEFKNSFMNNVEIGGSPTKKDYACFNDRNLNFSNMCGDRGI